MNGSYVGIVSRLGLEGIWVEERHAVPFLLKRVARIRDRQACCFWAVMDCALANRVAEQIYLGNGYDAALLLNSVAVDLGLVFPEP